MTPTLAQFKPLFLGTAILLGIAVQHVQANAQTTQTEAATETAILAGGCFWCVESNFETVEGVVDVVSGFAGGTTSNPTYRQVVRGGTGHFEAVLITYQPDVITYDELLYLFLRSSDPTDAGGQFCDRGATYSTAIFAQDSEELVIAESAIDAAESELGQQIVTPVLNVTNFYPAEEYHQDYYKKDEIILTRFGFRSKAEAYKRYRNGCGRDQRVTQLWGDAAEFVHNN